MRPLESPWPEQSPQKSSSLGPPKGKAESLGVVPRFLNRRYPDKGFRALEDSLCTRSGMPQETQVFSPNKCRSIFSVPCFVSVKTILFKSRLYSPVFFSPRSCRPLQTKQRRVPQGSRMHATRGESLLQLPERIQGGWLYVPSSKSLR